MRDAPANNRRGVSRLRYVISLFVLLIVLAILYGIHLGQIDRFVVTSASMEPTLRIDDELVMIEPISFQEGSIIVFPDPDDSKKMVVKRLVALGPGHAEVRGGYLYVNGQRSLPPQGEVEPTDMPDHEWNLIAGEGFAVGDNRTRSKDSRDFGPIRTMNLRGVITYRTFPKGRRGKVE